MTLTTLLNEFEQQPNKPAEPVTCLGLTFANDEQRREHFTEQLRQKLQDPAFRKIEGFPLGSDEDILNLSDPPYYTACPNPWLAEFIAEWEKSRGECLVASDGVSDEGRVASDEKENSSHSPLTTNHYHREPFAADVSEGKNDPIYNAHSYHTKVPHKAIMRYILHYTNPGDIVFDGFCGTGMTGVAAQLCGDKNVVMELGYRVDKDGVIYQEVDEVLSDEGQVISGEKKDSSHSPLTTRHYKAFSKLGVRRAVLNDLSPAATFIAYNYNTPVDVVAFEQEAKRILQEVEQECGWMYETLHSDGKTKGKINCTVWSDVFVCPECTQEVIFWEAAVNKDAGKVHDAFPCPHCHATLTKRTMERAWVNKFDSALNDSIRQAKQVPVLITYTVSGKRAEKIPDALDLALIEKIEDSEIPYWFPTKRMTEGKETRRNDPAGITHVHHFYTKRNLYALAKFKNIAKKSNFYHSLQYQLDSLIIRQSKLTRFLISYYFHGGGGWVGTPLSGTFYIPSFSVEVQPFETWANRISKTLARIKNEHSFVCSTGNVARTDITSSSMDYLFLDPPFGSNLMYSELNFLWESWLKVWTDNKPEAIENSVQGKGSTEYRHLMTACFKEAYRVLKPGRWMTVEFSNTKAAVWNSIQTALTEAGFIVANVSALDKQQGSFKAVTTTTAVKQDLVISAYKPNGGFEERFLQEAQSEEGVWDFVRTHLKYLPVSKQQNSVLQIIPERDPRILFDQMIAYYVRKGYPVPISSQEFQAGLSQRFSERDGMIFLPEQIAEYDRKKAISGQTPQMTLFVSDESSAIEWLRGKLKSKPQAYNDIQPDFMPLLSHLNANERDLINLELLLQQNFLCYDGKELVPEQIHAYLSSNWKELRNLPKDDATLKAKASDRWYVPDPNKAGDLEKLREKALLKEFDHYKEAKKKLKIFRLEAVRAGFKKSWQDRDYATIVAVAEKIPSNILEEDPKLLMWYDQAVTRMGD